MLTQGVVDSGAPGSIGHAPDSQDLGCWMVSPQEGLSGQYIQHTGCMKEISR